MQLIKMYWLQYMSETYAFWLKQRPETKKKKQNFIPESKAT